MSGGEQPKVFYGYIVVGAAFFILAILSGTSYSFGVFFKPLLTEFGWTRAMTAGAYSTFMILHGSLYIVTGRLNDRLGPRVVMTACGFLAGLGYILMSQVSAIWQVYLIYGVVIACGMSGGYVPLVSTVARWFVKRRGLMTGIAVAGVGAGTVTVPPAASWLITTYGWRTSYVVVGIAAMVVIIIAAQFLRRDPRQMGYLPYGAGETKTASIDIQTSGLSLSKAVRTGQFWIIAIIFLFFGFYQQVVMVHTVPHATDLGISPIIAANILSIIGGIGIAGRVIMGSAGDRIGRKSGVVVSSVLMTIALFWLLVAKEVWAFYLIAVIFGFGYGGFITTQSPLVAELFGLKAHGILVGISTFGTTIGGGIGPAFAGQIFDVIGSYQVAFLVCAIVAVMTSGLTLFLRPVSGKEGTK